VWAGWLPLCSLLALAAFGLGAGPVATVGGFFVLYNVGHVALRLWALETGWSKGLRVAPALGATLLRQGPEHVARAAALLAGIAIPLALQRVTGPGRGLLAAELAAVVAGAILLARLHGRVEGWRVTLGILAGFVLFSVLRHG
jgi:PTS system mannose-specific IID component